MLKKAKDQLILKLACLAGKIVLENGGEVYRVEDVVCRVGAFYGLKIECFATLTCIIASSTNGDGEISSLVQRITSRGTNLNKVSILNNIVRNLDKYSFDSLQEELTKLYNDKTSSFMRSFIGYSLGAGSFVFLFKGSFRDFIPAFITGALMAISDKITSSLEINSFFGNLVGSAIASFVAYSFFHFKLVADPSISIISSLMILVPGLAFINAIRDIIAGDLVAGVSRSMEVIMTGVALAVGAGITLKILIGLGGI